MSDATQLSRICSLSDVSDDEPLRVDLDGFIYAVFQVEDDYYVTADQCSHGPGSLSEGFVEDCQVECPFHQGRFDLRTGQPTLAPCEVPIKVWEPVVRDGEIFINAASPKAS
jgi:anthranilate 1,2-dioxygenase ferredoxin subunit